MHMTNRLFSILVSVCAAGALTGCVVVVDGNGDVDTEWASSYSESRSEQAEADKAMARAVSDALAEDPQLAGQDISVSVYRDTVTLHGRALTPADLDRALKTAAATPGVSRVVSRLSVEVTAE
jgi:osmotically-inducible protein OsmY